MSVAHIHESAFSVEDCQRLAPPLRNDLELLDYDMRRAIARIRADARGDDAQLIKGATTVLLTIAADLAVRAAETRRARFDADSFLAGAESAAQWAQERRLRLYLGGEG